MHLTILTSDLKAESNFQNQEYFFKIEKNISKSNKAIQNREKFYEIDKKISKLQKVL